MTDRESDGERIRALEVWIESLRTQLAAHSANSARQSEEIKKEIKAITANMERWIGASKVVGLIGSLGILSTVVHWAAELLGLHSSGGPR